MKNLSKVLAVVLALVMALSMVSFAAYTDVADDANYAEAVSVLSALEMLKGYEDGTFKPEGDITRAEFAMVICRLIGSGAAAETTGATQFTDVTGEHWASGAIALAAQNGIVNGYPDGTFKPDNNVKYEEAIKMVVAALGYDAVAKSYGEYPTGYQIVAAQTGVLDGITDGKVGLPASRGVVAQLAYNALEVPMMTQTGFGTNVAYNYDNTLLLNRINVVKVEAEITGTAKSNSALKADEVGLTVDRQFAAEKENSEAGWYPTTAQGIKPAINDAAWKTASKIKASEEIIAKAEGLIDYKVDAYIINPTDSRKAELVAIEMKDAGYSEITFATEDIDMTNTDTVAYTELAIYTDETKEDSEIYDINITKVYVNGREDDVITAAQFLNDTAEADIRLFDNNGDDVYDYAYVTAYVDYVVESVNVRNYRINGTAATHPILGSWPTKLILDEENEDYTFEIIKDGEVVDFTAIAENDVISVSGGRKSNVSGSTGYNDLEFGTVIINSQSVTGTVDGIDEDNEIIIIDGVEYSYNNTIAAEIAGSTLELGDKADFYINARGIICGLDRTSKVGNLKYGFLTVAMESTGLTADTMELRMMDTEGAWNTYVLDKDFDLDGATGVVDTFKGYGDNSVNAAKYVYNKVVAYELNADGEIDNIYVTPAAGTDFVSDNNVAELAYNAATEIYNSKTLTESTVIFAVPSTPSATVAVDEDDVTVVKKDVLVDRANYAMTAFNTTEDGEAVVLLGVGITGKIDWAANFMIITGKSTRANAKGEVCVKLEGLVNGEAVSLLSVQSSNNVIAMTDDGAAIAEGSVLGNASILDKGDVILYSVNGAGEAAKIVLVQDATVIDGFVDADNFVNEYQDVDGNGDPVFDGNGDPVMVGSTKLGSISVAGTSYTYYLGYVNAVKASRITIQADNTTAMTAAQALTVKADSVVTEINTNHATGVKIVAGDMGSFVADSGIVNENTVDNDGDIVLIKAVNDVVVVEAVIYRANVN